MITCHYHTCHPEEDDIGSRYQIVGRVVVVYLLVVGVDDTVEYRYRPQPRREPRIEAVVVLSERVSACHIGVAIGDTASLLFGLGNYDHLLGKAACGRVELCGIVCRYLMSPPELPTDTPIFYIGHPVAVCVFELFGVKPYGIALDRLQSRLSQTVHLQPPLHRKLRLDRHIGTFGEPYFVRIRLDTFYQTRLGEVFLYLSTTRETVETCVHRSVVVESAVVVEDVDTRQIVLLTEHIVVDVVCGGNFEATRTELDIDVVVFYDGYRAIDERYHDAFSPQVCCLRIVRVDTHCRIAHYGLGACGGDNGIFVCPTLRMLRYNLVTEIIEFALLLFVCYLLVAEGGLCFRVPIDHSDTAIYEPLSVQVAEYAYYRLGAYLVHSERRAVPVAGAAEFFELFEYYASVSVCPFPSVA